MSTNKSLQERLQALDLEDTINEAEISSLSEQLMLVAYPNFPAVKLINQTLILRAILCELKLYNYLSTHSFPVLDGDRAARLYKQIIQNTGELTHDENFRARTHALATALNLVIAFEKAMNIQIAYTFFYRFLFLLFKTSNAEIYATLTMCVPDARERMFPVLSKFGQALDFETFNSVIKTMTQRPDLDYLRVENLVDEYLHDDFTVHYRRLKGQATCISQILHQDYVASLKPKIEAVYLAFESNQPMSESEEKLIIHSLRLTNRLLLSEPGSEREALLSEYQTLITTFKNNSPLYKASLCMLALALAIMVIGVTAVFLNIVTVPLLVPVATGAAVGFLGAVGLFAWRTVNPMQQIHNEIDNTISCTLVGT